MDSPHGTRKLDAVVRTLVTAGKSLRLYPASSPIPLQSVQAVLDALDQFFADGDSVLVLSVAREGFSFDGEPLPATLGASDLVDQLRAHAVAELDIVAGCRNEEILALLSLLERSPEEVRAEGGLGVALTTASVDNVRVSEVQLTVVDHTSPEPDENVDEFLRDLVSDPDRLSAWFEAASTGDLATFEEGLMELVRVSGPSGYESLLKSLSSVFLSQPSESKDALLSLAMDSGPTRDLTGGVFCLMSSNDIAGSVLEGSFGRNMLSLSSALTRLPLEQVTAQVRAEVQAMLPGAGHTTKEVEFLDHMLRVREMKTPEPSLVDADRTYRTVAEAATLPEEVIERARGAVSGSTGSLSGASVRTMLTLLDQQKDFELYCSTALNLASLVPRLIEQGDVAMAARIITELFNRESLEVGPWPELSGRMHEALTVAAGPRSMGALVKAVTANPSLLPVAQLIMRHAGEAGAPALVMEAISLKTEGLNIAEKLLGRRIVDQLNNIASQLQWFQLGPVAARLAAEGDSNSQRTLEALMQRPDEQSRREVVGGVAAAGGAIANRLISAALRDSSPEVAIPAARALGRSSQPDSAELLVKRLAELDVDHAGFVLGREIISALAHRPEAVAGEALARMAHRRTLIKRGHYGEIQDLVRQAQEIRARESGAR